MHIHDEVVIEADRRMSLQAVCDQMGRTPPWAEGLQLRADGYETDFFNTNTMKELWTTVQLIFVGLGGWLGWFLGGCDGLLFALVALPL